MAKPATPPQAGQDAGYTPVARVISRQSATVGVCPLSLEAYHCMEVERTLYLRDAETWKNPDWKDTPPVAESARIAPREPTEAMLEAARCNTGCHRPCEICDSASRKTWKLMWDTLEMMDKIDPVPQAHARKI